MASYHVYQLLWIFFVYSFIGWCGEAAMAAVRRHKFVNRGFVSGPLCPVYGAGAAAVAVFLPELHDRLFFLFLGGMIVTTFVEYLTGRLLELIFHRKWWDYSDEKFNLDGYVCLKNSAIWGLCSVLMICFFDPLLCRLIDLIPRLAGNILLWILGVLLVIDAVGSGVAVLGLKKKQSRITQITEELHKTSKLLENALTTRIQKRMVRAFPNIEGTEGAGVKTKEERFARGCGFFKLASLFILGAFLGDIVETVFCLVTTGRLMSRSSLVFGPFSIVWGLACALLTWILYRYRDKSDRYIFVFGEIPFNLGGRINLLYCFFWGIAAVVWMKGVYPFLSRWIEKLPARMGKVVCSVLLVLLAADMLVSALALARYSERQAGKAEQTAVGQALDEFFPDGFIEKRYENLKLTD